MGSLKSKISFQQLDVRSFFEDFQHLHLPLSKIFVNEVEFPEWNINLELNKTFSYEEVRESLWIPKCDKSAGQDYVHPEFLKYVPVNLV